MRYTYKTRNTCSREISFDVTGNVITNIQFIGGCNGNLKAIPALVNGWTAEEIAAKLSGITCSGRPTSCGDQLARAVMQAINNTEGR